MERRHLSKKIGSTIGASAWWTTIAPFCWATEMPAVGASRRPIRLASEPDLYPITELLGRLQWFRGRLRLARSLVIVQRAVILCALVLLVAKLFEAMTHQPQTGWLPLILFFIVGWAIHLSLHHTITPFEVARLVDQRLELDAQIATAVEFTLGDRLDRPLARTQVRLATNRLRDLEPKEAIPLALPGRDFRVFALVAVLYAAVTYAATLGINLPRQLRPIDAELAKQAGLQAQSPSPYITIDPSLSPLQQQTAQLLDTSGKRGPVEDKLNSLRQQLDSQQITDAEFQKQLEQVQLAVQAQASQSLQAQSALNSLAAALKDVSTTQSISTSLTRGDYDQASQQLTDLSKQLGQLSTDARSELADRLAQASTQTQKTSPNISRDTGAAASALKQGDSAAASQALQALAQSVQQASQQIAQQSQIGQDMRDVQQQLGHGQTTPPGAGSPEISSGDSQGAGGDASAGQGDAQDLASERAGTGGLSAADGQTSGSDLGRGEGSGIASTRTSGPSIEPDQQGGGSGVGSAPGSNPLGAANPLDVHGVPLTILGKPSQGAPSTTAAGDRSLPLTNAGGGNINGLAGSGSVPSDIPINVHQDSNVVPLDRKPMVREYFSDANN